MKRSLAVLVAMGMLTSVFAAVETHSPDHEKATHPKHNKVHSSPQPETSDEFMVCVVR